MNSSHSRILKDEAAVRQFDLVLFEQTGSHDEGNYYVLPIILKLRHHQRHRRVGVPQFAVVLQKDAIDGDFEVVRVTLEALARLLVRTLRWDATSGRKNSSVMLNVGPEAIPPLLEISHDFTPCVRLD